MGKPKPCPCWRPLDDLPAQVVGAAQQAGGLVDRARLDAVTNAGGAHRRALSAPQVVAVHDEPVELAELTQALDRALVARTEAEVVAHVDGLRVHDAAEHLAQKALDRVAGKLSRERDDHDVVGPEGAQVLDAVLVVEELADALGGQEELVGVGVERDDGAGDAPLARVGDCAGEEEPVAQVDAVEGADRADDLADGGGHGLGGLYAHHLGQGGPAALLPIGRVRQQEGPTGELDGLISCHHALHCRYRLFRPQAPSAAAGADPHGRQARRGDRHG